MDPLTCPKCQGAGHLRDGEVCPKCQGVANQGNKSEAARFLLHQALGQRETPEVRSLVAAYSETRAKFFQVIMSTAHRMELTFHDEVIGAVRDIQLARRRRK